MKLLLSFVLLATACGGTSASIDDAPSSPAPAPSAPSAPPEPGATEARDPATGAEVTIAMKGSTAAFAHADGLPGQTPRKQIVAIRSLWLYRSDSDPSPVRVFDHGPAAVEVDLVTGKVVEIATVRAKSLPAGVFAIARAGVAHVRYDIDARMHAPFAIDGHYENVQALSDGAVIDGKKKNKGDYRYAFVKDGTTLGAIEGADAPVPASATAGGITMDSSGPETFYLFPVQLKVDPDVAKDQLVTLELNVHESFRWSDVTAPGYQKGVYDTTPSTFEPVVTFGANGFSLRIEER